MHRSGIRKCKDSQNVNVNAVLGSFCFLSDASEVRKAARCPSSPYRTFLREDEEPQISGRGPRPPPSGSGPRERVRGERRAGRARRAAGVRATSPGAGPERRAPEGGPPCIGRPLGVCGRPPAEPGGRPAGVPPTRVALARLFEDIILWLTLIRLHVLRLGPLLGLDIYVLNVASFLLGLENC